MVKQEYSVKTVTLPTGDKAKVELGYTHPANLRPYHTVEKQLYGRYAQFKMFKSTKEIPKKAVKLYNQRREAYREIQNLLKQHKLDRAIVGVKKHADSDWVDFVPAGVNIDLDAYLENRYLHNYYNSWNHEEDCFFSLFSYSIIEQSMDREFFISNEIYKQAKLAKIQKPVQAHDGFGYSFYPFEETVKVVETIAKFRDYCSECFKPYRQKMTDKHFSWLLTLAMLKESELVNGSIKAWVKYMCDGYAFNLYEIMFAFNPTFQLSKTRTVPVPRKHVREYIDLPSDWVKPLVGV